MYLNDAMLLLDDARMQEVINEKDPGSYLPKAVLQVNIVWRERMKEAII